MTDSSGLKEDGLSKMPHNVNSIEIHYVKNIKIGEFNVFKIKDKNK